MRPRHAIHLLLAGAFLLAPAGGTGHAQTRSGAESLPESHETTARPKKKRHMPQPGRDRFKKAKVRKAVVYEISADGLDSTLTTEIDVDANGNATRKKERDHRGQFVEEEIEVDPGRDVVTKVRRGQDQTEVELEYDGDTLVTFVRSRKNGWEFARTEHEYDGDGRLMRIHSDQADTTAGPPRRHARTEFSYDAQDNVDEAVTYDLRQHPERNPTGSRKISRMKHTYGTNGLVSRLDVYQVDVVNQPPGPDVLGMFSTYEYDGEGRLTGIRSYRRFGDRDTLVSEEIHRYDDDGNEVETSILLPVPAAVDTTTPVPPGLRGQDLLDALPKASVQAVRKQTTARTFDGFGNIVSETIDETLRGVPVPGARKTRRTHYENFD